MIQELIDELNAVEDPALRGRLATEALESVKAFNTAVAAIRREAARELRAEGLTYKQIGERFGPEGEPLHFSRVNQILKGEPTGKLAKLARDAETKAGE
ncbi:hypothetical protein ACSNOI_03235 [Actinomadura kijaniata]|uniref:hypothetical protein n=1 Tax=Actinomadura kijaniata TaxID=46161 RepID=UPI003F1A6BA4